MRSGLFAVCNAPMSNSKHHPCVELFCRSMRVKLRLMQRPNIEKGQQGNNVTEERQFSSAARASMNAEGQQH